MKYDEKNNCIENWELPTTHTLIAHKIGMNHLLKNILKVIGRNKGFERIYQQSEIFGWLSGQFDLQRI